MFPGSALYKTWFVGQIIKEIIIDIYSIEVWTNSLLKTIKVIYKHTLFGKVPFLEKINFLRNKENQSQNKINTLLL